MDHRHFECWRALKDGKAIGPAEERRQFAAVVHGDVGRFPLRMADF
jgi:hypothetical protein